MVSYELIAFFFNFLNFSFVRLGLSAPPVPPRHFEQQPSVGTKLEGLLLNEIESDQDFDPRSFENENNGSSHLFSNMNGSANSPPLRKFFLDFKPKLIRIIKIYYFLFSDVRKKYRNHEILSFSTFDGIIRFRHL